MYDNYIFDLYGTLADIHTNENKPYLYKKIAALYASYGASYTPGEWKGQYAASCKVRKDADKNPYGEIQLLEVFEELFTLKGITVSEDTLAAIANIYRVLSRDYIKLYDYVLPFFRHLREKGKNIYLLSNAQACFTVPELKVLGIYDMFDGIVISSEAGICKPDVAIMDCLIKKHNLDSSKSIMIGNDRTSDVQVAISSGMDSLYMHSNISPQVTDEYNQIKATYEVLDGDFSKIDSLLIR